jgi:hypothetical protein
MAEELQLQNTLFENDRVRCGNPECSVGWLRFLKDRRRPLFEGRWGCTAQCIAGMVESAVRREAGKSSTASNEGLHRHQMPLGLILLAQGWITHAQLQCALEAQRRAGTGRIGQWLIDECGLPRECIVRALGMQWRCPVMSTEGFVPETMALVAPRVLVEAFGMVPLRKTGRRTLHLAFEDRIDAAAAFAIEKMSGLKVESGFIDGAAFLAAHRCLYASSFIDAGFEHAPNTEAISKRIATTLTNFQPRASSVVRVHEFYWLRMWLDSRAMTVPGGGIPQTSEDIIDHVYAVGASQ